MLEKYDPAVAGEIDVDEDCIDEFTDRADRFFIGLSKAVETEWDDRQLDMLMQTVPNFERIGDYATNLVELSQRLVADNATFSDMAQRELKLIFDAVNEILTITVDAFAKGDNEAAKRIEPLEETIDDMVMILRDRHTKRLKSGACSVGSGLVFLAGASTGGSDIVVRLLKLKWRNVPIGKIVLISDAVVVALTALTFRNMTSILYCGITLYVCTQVLDAVVYSFDYSKVALIISERHEEIASAVLHELDRGATFLNGQGAYSGKERKVVLVAIKRQQLAELKELVVGIDPSAFIILQDSHQVLGDGFARYTRDSL